MGKYKDRINERIDRQIAKGVNKYGQVLEDNPRGVLNALTYQAEELTDALFYTEEAIEKMQKVNKLVEDTKKIYKEYCEPCRSIKFLNTHIESPCLRCALNFVQEFMKED